MSSEQPSLAIYAFRRQLPGKTHLFAHDVQHAFYYDGRDLNAEATFLELVSHYNVDDSAFSDAFRDPDSRSAVYDEFAAALNMGLRGFPTLFLEKEGELEKLSHGYKPYAELKVVLDKAL